MSHETNILPIVEAQGLRVSEGSDTEAHAFKSGRDVPEAEAHAFRRSAPSETEAHASLRISFPPQTDEQTLTIVYRPAANAGDEPEVELHRAYARSDARLKRDIRAV